MWIRHSLKGHRNPPSHKFMHKAYLPLNPSLTNSLKTQDWLGDLWALENPSLGSRGRWGSIWWSERKESWTAGAVVAIVPEISVWDINTLPAAENFPSTSLIVCYRIKLIIPHNGYSFLLVCVDLFGKSLETAILSGAPMQFGLLNTQKHLLCILFPVGTNAAWGTWGQAWAEKKMSPDEKS